MATIAKLSRLVNGVQRDVDLSNNTLKVNTLLATSKLQIGAEGSATDLTQTQLDSLLAHDHASGSDNQTITAGDGLTGGGSGASVSLAVGAGDGISVAADAVAVDATVMRNNADQTLGSNVDITFAGGEVLGLPAVPSVDGAAASKKYVNDQDALKVSKTGDTMSGSLTMGGSINMQSTQKVINLAAGTAAGDAVNKAQLDDKADLVDVVRVDVDTTLDSNVDITFAGGEVLGLPAIPSVDGAAASKKYVNDQDALKANATDVIMKDGSVAFTGDQSMGGNQLTNVGAPAVDTDAATKKYADDQDALKVSKAGDTMSGFLTLHADPTSDMHAATKACVDSVAQGLDVHAEVAIKMDPSDLPAFTAAGANDTKTLTADANGALGTIQGHVVALGESIMLADSPASSDDGIYVVDDLGSAGTPWILSRRSHEDGTPANELQPGDFFFVAFGTYASTGWVVTAEGDLNTDGNIDIDNGDKFTVVQFSGAGTYTADGQGIEISGSQISLELDGSTLSKSASGVKVASSGITATELASSSVEEAKIAASAVTEGKIGASAVTEGKIATGAVTINKIGAAAVDENKLAASVAGAGLSGGAGSPLSVNVDGLGLEVVTDQLTIELDGSTLSKSSAGIKVATGGISNNEVAAAADIALNKLASGTAANIIVANASGVPTYTAMSGDVTVSDAGITAIGASKVTNSMLAGSIDDSKLSQITTANKVAGSAVQLKSGAGIKNDTGLAVEPADIAGNGLEDNGSDKLQIKLAPNSGLTLDGNGLAVAGGSTTQVVAGQSFSANVTMLVRFAMSGETAGRVYKADNDASVSDKFYVVGLVQPSAAIAAGENMMMASFGVLTLGTGDTNFAAGDIGKPVYLSASGGFTITPPTTTNMAVAQIGVVQEVNKIWVQHVRVMGVN